MRKYFLHFFILGTICGSILFNFGATNYLAITLLLISLNLLVLSLLKRSAVASLVCISLILCSLVIYRGNKIFNEPTIPILADQKIEVVGEVIGEPDVRDTTTRLFVDVEYLIDEKNRNKLLNESIIVVTSHYPEYKTGDVIKVAGTIKTPENFENENGIVFDYVNYLGKDKIYSLTYYPRIEKIESSEDNITRQIFKFKTLFLEKIQSIMPSPESELLGGILLGTKRSLGADLEEKFRRTGLIHIVVLSGYNVTIIAEAIFRFFGFLPKIIATSLGVICILIFTVMVGSGATVVRATIMALLALTARITGKNYAVNRALFLAGAVMIIHNPMVLIHDPSFQLSFLATVGLINLGEFVKRFLILIPEKFELREISSATLSTQIAVLPLLMKMTGELSVVAPIVNIITLQVIPLTMLLGFISGIVGFINHNLGVVVAFLPYLSLKYVLVIVDFFSGFNFAVWRFV